MIVADKFADIVADFAKDSSKEVSGVWVPYKGAEYRIARAHRNNTAFSKLLEEKMRPYQWAIERNNLQSVKTAVDAVMRGVYAETVLKGIRTICKTVDGVEVPGKELDYETSDGVALFNKLPDLWDFVFKQANAEESYAPDAVKDDSGN